jgi:hypothetical protein
VRNCQISRRVAEGCSRYAQQSVPVKHIKVITKTIHFGVLTSETLLISTARSAKISARKKHTQLFATYQSAHVGGGRSCNFRQEEIL